MIQIELQPETEARYAAEAQARGLELERYIAEKLEAEVAPVPKKEMSMAEKLADLEVFLWSLRSTRTKFLCFPRRHLPGKASTEITRDCVSATY